MKKNWGLLVFCILGVQLVGILSGLLFSASNSSWYDNLIKPSFNPPSYLFGIVWPILYLLIGISLYLVLKEESKNKVKVKNKTLIIFGIQLFLNFIWSLLFFKLESSLLGLVDILILLVFIILNIIYTYKISKTSAYLLIPYLLWVGFAVILNLAIFLLN